MIEADLTEHGVQVLREIVTERQPQPAERRWFTSEHADLYIWQDPSGSISGFEYCYRTGAREYSLRWNMRRGIEYAVIDDGESVPLRNNSPIAIMIDKPDWDLLLQHFRAESRSVDTGLYQFVLHKMLKAACAS